MRLGCRPKKKRRSRADRRRIDRVSNLELVILIGLPGSGKSTFARTQLSRTHVCVSKDAFPNAKRREQRQQRLITDALRQGRSVVVDNTNSRRVDRLPLLALGRSFGAHVIAHFFEAAVRDCLVRNRQREGRARVPDVALFTIAKRLEPPSYEEGFDTIFRVRIAGNLQFEATMLPANQSYQR